MTVPFGRAGAEEFLRVAPAVNYPQEVGRTSSRVSMSTYDTAFKLKLIKSLLAGEGGAKLLAWRWSAPEQKIRV